MSSDSEKKSDGGPAFPCDSREAAQFSGMSLRDWFAEGAMRALIGSIQPDDWEDITSEERVNAEHRTALARDAYAYAEAMLAERSRR